MIWKRPHYISGEQEAPSCSLADAFLGREAKLSTTLVQTTDVDMEKCKAKVNKR